MEIALVELTPGDGPEIYELLREIGPGENGFVNDGYVPPAAFKAYLQKYAGFAKGLELPPGGVPVTMYWLYMDGEPVGYGKIRHRLNEELEKIGGHIGYAIRPSKRGLGLGKVILRELLKKAKELGLDEVLMTCMEENMASRHVIQANGGELVGIADGECYWRVFTKME